MRVLVTGADGFIGRRVLPVLWDLGHETVAFDLPDGDVRDVAALRRYADCAACIHLAGLKYATTSELDPLPTVDVNVTGTANVCAVFGGRAVIASTCKAADPETVYGASKLLAERVGLLAGARVVRLVNVLGSSGSVTEIWDRVPAGSPLPVCDATRLFMTADQAAELFVSALEWPTGRYGPRDARHLHIDELAAELHPGRETVRIPLRRGDRRHERLLADCEHDSAWSDRVVSITAVHDAHELEAAVAA